MSDDKRLERIENKVDTIKDHLGSMDATLQGQHISLKEHMRRTELLEKQVEPIKKHVDMMTGALKLLGVLATIAAIYEGFRMIFQ